MARLVAVFGVLLGSLALADTSPMVIAAPLEVRRSTGGETTKALQKELRTLLVKQPNVLTPPYSAWDTAVAAVKRQDCETNDDCLRELAVTAGTLYAIYVEVEQDPTKTEVIAVGRIVRKDGVLIEIEGKRFARVQLPRGADSFEAVAKVALARVLGSMKLSSLPPTMPAAEVPVVKQETPDAGTPVAAVTADAGIPPPPPLVIETPPTPPARIASYALLGVGAVSILTGGAFGVVAIADRGGIQADSAGNLLPGQTGKQRSVDTNATVSAVTLSVGAACVAAGITLMALAPGTDDHTILTVAPMPGGAAVMLSGRLP